jgi:hypothetical protein
MLRMTHYEGDGSPTFVFDMMEPERPKVDLAVLSQIGGVAFGGFHDEDGVVRLNPELGERVAGLALCHCSDLASSRKYRDASSQLSRKAVNGELGEWYS